MTGSWDMACTSHCAYFVIISALTSFLKSAITHLVDWFLDTTSSPMFNLLIVGYRASTFFVPDTWSVLLDMSAMVGYTLPCIPSVPTVHSDSVTLDSVPTPIRASLCVANSLRIHTPSVTFPFRKSVRLRFLASSQLCWSYFPIASPIPSCR